MIEDLDDIVDLKDLPTSIEVHCPFCPMHYQDGKKKLSIDFSKNVYHCWRCNAKGRASDLLNRFTQLSHSEIISYMFSKDEFINRSLNHQEIKKEVVTSELFAYDAISLKIIENSLNNAKLYLNNRGISDKDIEYYDIRVGKHNTAFKNRIIIPTYDEYGNVCYFVARDYVNPNNPRKYLNSAGSNKSSHVWNLNHAKENDIIILCEGCFSGISADRIPNMTAVCTYGKFISSTQAKLIAKKHPREIIMSLDGDVPFDEVRNNIHIIRAFYRGSISYITIPDKKDPNDLSYEEYKNLIDNRKRYLDGVGKRIEMAQTLTSVS